MPADGVRAGGVSRPVVLIALLCLAEIVSMATFSSVAALLPELREAFTLSGTTAGWLNGLYFAGYLLAVPVLMSLTDTVDARRIYGIGAAISLVAALGFAIGANGFWSEVFWRILGGMGLAGTFMVGLRLLTDRVPDGWRTRAVAFYTACFSIGASVSYLLSGWVAHAAGWRAAFMAGAAGSAIAWGLVVAVTRPSGTKTGRLRFPDLDFRPVFANRRAMAFILAYAAHLWELFGYRAWIVAFLAYTASLGGGLPLALKATTLAAAINLMGLPASIIGIEISDRLGRVPVLKAMMSLSSALGIGIGLLAGLEAAWMVPLLFLYAVTVSWDSASLTAGAVEAAEPDHLGVTMALHTMIGFTCSFLAPLGFGIALDLFDDGGAGGWRAGFIVLALGGLFGPLVLWRLRADEA